MRTKMTRGKQQVLFEYLPGRTFDFDKSNRLALITSIRGMLETDINKDLVLKAIERYASVWQENLASIFHRTLSEKFVFLKPTEVRSQTYPNVMWCQNKSCGRVFDNRARVQPLNSTCQHCRNGKLIQLKWIKVHRCGHIEELTPPYCKTCRSAKDQSLDERDSERISGFRWICLRCNQLTGVFSGYCRACNWEKMSGSTDKSLRFMNIDTHRAARAHYPHYVQLLNQPSAKLNAFLNLSDWQFITAASFLELPQIRGQTLMQFAEKHRESPQTHLEFSEQETDRLRKLGHTDAAIEKIQSALQDVRQESSQNQSTTNFTQLLFEKTGVSEEIWRNAGYEMLEAVLPTQTGQTQELFHLDNTLPSLQAACRISKGMGVKNLTLTTDFPITLATFGFSRVTNEPNECKLNAFPPDGDHQGKFPIFVNVIQADAIIVRLDPERVWRWLVENGFSPMFPNNATNPEMARRAYFVQLFENIPLRQRLTNEEAEARMVFGLLHTMSHLFVRRASLLCGLDQTSLAEYVLPRALSFAIYCGHSKGATIGALASLFEQSLTEWLNQILSDTRRCHYDPVCHQHQGGNCHACTHLAETSCRFFNLNLGRCFLFGGPDDEIGEIHVGYFDPRLNHE